MINGLDLDEYIIYIPSIQIWFNCGHLVALSDFFGAIVYNSFVKNLLSAQPSS